VTLTMHTLGLSYAADTYTCSTITRTPCDYMYNVHMT